MKIDCSCGQPVYYGLKHLGKEVKCKKCGTLHQIPRPKYYKLKLILGVFIIISLAVWLVIAVIALVRPLFYQPQLPPLKEFNGPGFKMNIPETWREENRREGDEEFSTLLYDGKDGRNTLRIKVKPFPNLLARTALMTTEPWLNDPLLRLGINPIPPQQDKNYARLSYETNFESVNLRVIGRLMVDGEKVYSIRFTLYSDITYFSKWVRQYEKLLDSFTITKQPVALTPTGTYPLGKKISITFNSTPDNWLITLAEASEIHLVNYQFSACINISPLSLLKKQKSKEFNRELIYQNDVTRILSIALDEDKVANQRFLEKWIKKLDAKKSESLGQSMAQNLARMFTQMRWKTTQVLPIKISGHAGAQFRLVYFDPLEMENVVYVVYAIPVKNDTIFIRIILPEAQFQEASVDLNSLINGLQIKP